MTHIKDDVFARMDELTPAEKKVARSLLANYPSAGLASAATLARSAGTSSAWVMLRRSRMSRASSRIRAGVYLTGGGWGKPPACSPAPAIRNAIYHATGVAINQAPITPHVLFAKFTEAGLIQD